MGLPQEQFAQKNRHFARMAGQRLLSWKIGNPV